MSTLDAWPLYSSTVLEEFPVDVSMFANTLSDINFLFRIEALLTTKEAVWAWQDWVIVGSRAKAGVSSPLQSRQYRAAVHVSAVDTWSAKDNR